MEQRVLFDVGKMICRGFPMATGWYVQLGQDVGDVGSSVGGLRCEDCRQEAETEGVTGDGADGQVQEEPPCDRDHPRGAGFNWQGEGVFPCVEWAGYHPTWKSWRIMGRVGEPVATWETLAVVKLTRRLWQRGESDSSSFSDANGSGCGEGLGIADRFAYASGCSRFGVCRRRRFGDGWGGVIYEYTTAGVEVRGTLPERRMQGAMAKGRGEGQAAASRARC